MTEFHDREQTRVLPPQRIARATETFRAHALEHVAELEETARLYRAVLEGLPPSTLTWILILEQDRAMQALPALREAAESL